MNVRFVDNVRKTMITLSLCMIVRNEERVLGRCLDCVKDLVEEIIVVDTGSEDRTREIAAGYTDKVYEFTWIDDFSAARNYALEKATQDYCMWLDADDVITLGEQEKIRELKWALPLDTDVVMMRYALAFDEQGKAVFSYYRERLIKNCSQCRFVGRVHEVIVPFGKVIYQDIQIEHRKLEVSDPDRNLRIYEEMIEKGCTLSARELYYYGRELYEHRDWEKCERTLNRFLELPQGWKEDKKEACRLLASSFAERGREQEELRSLLRALEYGIPRAELCCDLGNWFFRQREWESSAYWYEQALQAPVLRDGFCQESCRGYVPCVQLSVCWYWLGDYEKALAYHQKAGEWNPMGKEYRNNVTFFERSAYGK